MQLEIIIYYNKSCPEKFYGQHALISKLFNSDSFYKSENKISELMFSLSVRMLQKMPIWS